MDFPQEVLFPQKTIFKKGSVQKITEEYLDFGRSGLVIHGKSLERNKKFKDWFSPGVEFLCRKEGEPSLDEISEVICRARSIKAEWIIGIGGGSVLDLAKASAGLFNAKEKPIFYQEGGILKEKGIPFIAVPTTAGTGSEATINAVIINPVKRVKLSIREKSFLAKKVVLDVDLLIGIPKNVIAWSGMDAFVQAYESYVSKNATWFSENFAIKAMDLINKNILAAYKTGAEENLSPLLLGSYLGGVALSASRLGVVHGLAHPLGVFYDIPHGLVCSACFIPSIELNKNFIADKYNNISNLLGMDFLERIKFLLNELKIDSPFKGKQIIEREKIIEDTLGSGSTAANPKQIQRQDVEFLLNQIF